MSTPRQHVSQFERNLRPAHRLFMQTVMNETRNIVIRKLTGEVLHRRTGRLASSIFAKVAQTRRRTTGSIGTRVWYGVMWEKYGHPAYTVVAKNARALAIPTGSAIGYRKQSGRVFEKKGIEAGLRSGTVIFRKRAHIPAAPPRPFIDPSIKQVQPFFRALHATTFPKVFPNDPIRIDIKVKPR